MSLERLAQEALEDNPVSIEALYFVLNNHYTRISPPEAANLVSLAETAAQRNNSQGLCLRGFLYHHGLGCPKDFQAARQYYVRAIALNNAEAMVNLAEMYHLGEGGDVDFIQAFDLYERAIALGNVRAMNECGLLYKDPGAGNINYPNAIALFERAIATGDLDGLCNRAEMYSLGEGGPVNKLTAIELYQRAMRMGSAKAPLKLARLFDEIGDFISAAKYSRAAIGLSDEDAPDFLRQIVAVVSNQIGGSLEVREAVYYHAGLAFMDFEYLKFIPAIKLLSLLAVDELVSTQVRFFITKTILDNDKQCENQLFAAVNLLGDYYYFEASTHLQKLPFIADDVQYQLHLDHALTLLNKVPEGSSKKGIALFDSGFHLYQSQKNNKLPQAVESSMPYFKASLAHGYTDAGEFYENMLLAFLDRPRLSSFNLNEVEDEVRQKLSEHQESEHKVAVSKHRDVLFSQKLKPTIVKKKTRTSKKSKTHGGKL